MQDKDMSKKIEEFISGTMKDLENILKEILIYMDATSKNLEGIDMQKIDDEEFCKLKKDIKDMKSEVKILCKIITDNNLVGPDPLLLSIVKMLEDQ